MFTYLKPAFMMLVIWTVLTGALYPAAVTGIAQLLFPVQANGSLIFTPEGKPMGSSLIGQPFSDPRYFWGRPSATVPYPYNAAASGGSNLGPTNPALLDAVKSRLAILREADPENTAPVPADLVTASASGLDPHISPAAAEYQISRVAQARHLDRTRLRELIQAHIDARQWRVLGEPRVNVFILNRGLNALH